MAQGLKDLADRYGDVARAAWAERHAHSAVDRTAEEAAFLPAHLELMEAPLHPAPRWTMRILCILAVLSLVIAIVGKLDIVVVASGELIPESNVKVVQPAITGVVRSILVRDGQHVVPGQPLIVLDTTQASADAATATSNRVHAALATARDRAILGSIENGLPPDLGRVDNVPATERHAADALAMQTWRAYRDKLQDAQAELAAREADLGVTQAQVAKLEATAPLARKQADAFKALLANKDVAQIDYLDREQTAQALVHELAAQRSHAAQLVAAVNQQKSEIAGTVSSFQRDQRLQLDKDAQALSTSLGDETKTATRRSLLTLTAPVAGTVQQLAVHTPGGVVTTAQALLEVVPGDTLRVKASIENRDIGFVREGQPVVVKVAAFPYTHYGYLKGTVAGVANDAATDRKRGSIFVAYVNLPETRMRIDDRWVPLTPGMAVSAEITTGRRRVISYFLGPLVRRVDESMHER
jgi:hemolysin D